MNYLQMFAKGGKTKGTDIIKGIQKILGVDDNQMAELWQVGINKYGSEEGIAQALNEATKGLTPQSSPDEVKSAVASVFSTGSEMFKCGGKLQRLAKRFAKGGSIDCGCGGIKVKSAQPGTKLVSDDKSITILNPFTEQADTTGHYSYPSTNGRFRFSPEGRTADVWDNTGGFPAHRYADEKWLQSHPNRIFGVKRELAPEDYWENLVERVNNRFQNVPTPESNLVITPNPEGKGDVAHIPMNQDGGEVAEAENGVRLTRRQARDLSKQNKGYSNSQYATAYANALDALRRNSDLRGKDLRNQARIMASGISVGDNSQSIVDSSTPEIAVAVAPAGQLNEVKTREQALNDLVSSVIRGNYGNGAQRRKALDSYYDEVQSEVAKRIRNTEKPVIDAKSKTSQKPVVYSSIERYTRYNNGPAFGGRFSTKVPVSTSNEQVVSSDTNDDTSSGYTRRPGMEGSVIRPYGPYYTKRANESPVRSYDGSYPNGYERREGMENEIVRPYGPYYTRRPGTDSVRPLTIQKGGIVKGQSGINSENIDSAPEQVIRIPKYGTIRLLRSRNFAGSEQPDSTFTFTPISKSAYYIPAGTYSRFTNYDGNVETRGYDVDGLNNFTYGETAHRQFNGIRSLWEANKDKRKIVIPKNTGTY